MAPLYLQHQQEAVAQTLAIMARTLQDNASLNFRPSIIAAAVLYCARRGQGQTPFWPVALVALTGYSATQSAELVAAITTVQRWACHDFHLLLDCSCMMWLCYQLPKQGLTLPSAVVDGSCRTLSGSACSGCCLCVCLSLLQQRRLLCTAESGAPPELQPAASKLKLAVLPMV